MIQSKIFPTTRINELKYPKGHNEQTITDILITLEQFATINSMNKEKKTNRFRSCLWKLGVRK